MHVGLPAVWICPASVAPFILRGVCLYGIDPVMCPLDRRREAWKRLETDLDRQKLALMTREIGLSEVFGMAASEIRFRGQVRGRIVVKNRVNTFRDLSTKAVHNLLGLKFGPKGAVDCCVSGEYGDGA